ncbi:ATP-binding protein [Sneathiella aquimaris]|uniref:ATP-binding protein n=1 Tax=Sneathiella aquimaris TaxID=2599305 RepID=UPI00146EDDF7|nr:ATP-binding protein [Sneathiella aquimaris]
MEQPRVIGYVVSVNGFRLKVELSTEAKSSSRATPDGVQRAVAINSFLTFDLGAGTHAIGILSDLEARESYDPTRDEELSLELTKPRRIASVQLLGTVRQSTNRSWLFDTGITVLPTLDTPAEVANPEVLSGIFALPPLRNRPRGSEDDNYDYPLEIGYLTGDENSKVKASFNDLFSRPLAVVGNTGSGKSYTVASLLRGVIEHEGLQSADADPHIFILDINGEYANAFLEGEAARHQREPNKIYLNGEEFCLPAWLMNGEEICDWLQASEATQEPVLKDWWAIAKASSAAPGTYDPLQVAIGKIDSAIAWLDGNTPASNFDLLISHARQYAVDLDWDAFDQLPNWSPNNQDQWRRVSNDREVRDRLGEFRAALLEAISQRQNEGVNFAKSADAPRFISLHEFRDPNLIDRSTDQDSNKRIDQYLLTLKLRLRTRLDDRRWQSFFSFEEQDVRSYEDWMGRLGVGQAAGSRISVLDLSMLASEILPFACAILGRLLLESREMLNPDVRSKYPWLLVLEEAHNYVRPPRAVEDRSLSLSRRAFERVAKEGRKFGLSLVVASQRPSEISPTIISQCANFFSHRLQNPDDIDHFRRIIPKQAQRLLDQVTVLAAGEAIVFGSAVHVPSRVQIRKPSQEPWSSTAAPYVDWATGDSFPLASVIESWGLADVEQEDVVENVNAVHMPVDAGEGQDDDDLPF